MSTSREGEAKREGEVKRAHELIASSWHAALTWVGDEHYIQSISHLCQLLALHQLPHILFTIT